MLTEMLTGGVRWLTARAWPSWPACPTGRRPWGSWRLSSTADIDPQLIGWLQRAYDRA